MTYSAGYATIPEDVAGLVRHYRRTLGSQWYEWHKHQTQSEGQRDQYFDNFSRIGR